MTLFPNASTVWSRDLNKKGWKLPVDYIPALRSHIPNEKPRLRSGVGHPIAVDKFSHQAKNIIVKASADKHFMTLPFFMRRLLKGEPLMISYCPIFNREWNSYSL